MKPEFDEVMKYLIFSHIMVIQKNDLKFSAKLVHSFLCKELMTSKRHEKWFTFARRPLHFGLQEKNSGLVTWKDDDGFWSKQIKTNEKINLQIIKKRHLEESNTYSDVNREPGPWDRPIKAWGGAGLGRVYGIPQNGRPRGLVL